MSLLESRISFKPFMYPWAYDAFEMQHKIHWLPGEVALGDDVRDWNSTLTNEERNLLTQIFRFFTQADISVSDCYMTHYSRIFKPTEINMMLSSFSAIGVDESEHTTYGVDIEQEIMDALADEIRSEIDSEFFQSIKGLIDPDDIQDMRQNL